jgi:hypothetical protein
MALTTMSIDKIVTPGIRKHFVDEYQQVKPALEKVLKVGNQESKIDTYENYTGLATVATVAEQGTYQEDLPIKAYGVALTPVKKGLMMPVTMEMRKWAKAKEIWDGSRHLARALARDVEDQAASLFNNAQSTAHTSYTDGKPLGSVDHTRADGGTAQSNASATGIVFSEANLEVALLALESQKDDRGQMITVFGNRLLIPPALRKQALIDLRSDGRSGTADNDVNVYKSMQSFYGSIEILVWDRLGAANGGSDTRWFLQDTSVSQLMWQWATKPNVTKNDEIGFKQDVTYYKGMYYASKGWRDFRGIWVSAGDGQAYAS